MQEKDYVSQRTQVNQLKSSFLSTRASASQIASGISRLCETNMPPSQSMKSF